MNAMNPDDFGADLGNLFKALGLVDASGNFNSDWLSDPEDYLKTILADANQRDALLEFVAAVRGGTEETDADERKWIVLFSEQVTTGVTAAFYLVVDEKPQDKPDDEVRIFVGIRFTTAAPLAASVSSLMIPLFRAAKAEAVSPPASADLLGQPGGILSVTSEITVADSPAPPGEAGLHRVGIRLSVPTDSADGEPVVGLSLGGLQLPGESTARDLTLSLTDPDEIRDTALDLILGLIQAQMNGTAGDQIRAFARLLGLGADPQIPDLPIDDLFARGVDALADWLAQALGDATRRAAWLQALADLLDVGATVDAAGMTIAIGGAQVRIGLAAEAGPSGRPVITLSTSFGFSDPTTHTSVRAVSELVRIDLGTGDAKALPILTAGAEFDLSAVSMTDVSLDKLVIGIGLDGARLPVFVLALENVTVFGTLHPRLDLTNPDALAAQAASAATDALSDMLGALGTPGTLIAIALGWEKPTGAGATYPTIDLLAFLGDPLGALASHWQEVLNNHASDVPRVLAALRQLLIGANPAAPVPGAGTEIDPWQIELAAGVAISVWRNGTRLLFGFLLTRSIDTLGWGSTVVETRISATLVSVDLAGGGASFLPAVSVRLLARAKGGGPLVANAGELRFEMHHVAVGLLWTPDSGLSLRMETPKPQFFVENVAIPLDVPDVWSDFAGFIGSLTDAQWEAFEQLAALLVRKLGVGWIDDIIEAMGWRRSVPGSRFPPPHRLRLADLVDDAPAELRRWLGELLADDVAEVEKLLQPLAGVLSGRPDLGFQVEGTGTFNDPWRFDLASGVGLPAIAVWREPDVPLPFPSVIDSQPLRAWFPGMPGLEPGLLATAIISEYPDLVGPFGAAIDPDEATLGLQELAESWQGGDGVVRPPAAPVANTTLHLVENQTEAEILDLMDLESILGAPPPATVIIRVLAHDATLPAELDLARVLDLRDPARDPLAFTPLAAASGISHVFLAPRADARLATADLDGVAGQAARLAHGLSAMVSEAGTVVVADAAAGHAAWRALNDMGAGLDTLVAVGLSVTAAQAPTTRGAGAAEMLRRLDEFCPPVDSAEPDDEDLAQGRRLLSLSLGTAARAASELALPAGWTGTVRGGLSIHLVYGVLDAERVERAMTAIAAAGLSFHAQARATARDLLKITSASLGAWLPLSSAAPAAGLIAVEGHMLAEFLGVDIDSSGPLPLPKPRTARRIAGALELRRSSGWLIGGPGVSAQPLDLELRSVEINLRVAVGGNAQPGLDRAEVILHGVRVEGRSYPRLVLSPDLPERTLGVDGQAAPSVPELRQMLSEVIDELLASSDPVIGRVTSLLRAFGIIDTGFDAISLSNWLDDPAAQLRHVLATGGMRDRLFSVLADLSGDHLGVSFDGTAKRATLTLSGTTGLPVVDTWDLSVTAGGSGVSAGTLHLGNPTGTNLAVSLVPFSVSLGLAESERSALGGMPATLPIWPAPDIQRIATALVPGLGCRLLSEALDSARTADPTLTPVIDAGLSAFGLLRMGAGGAKHVRIPIRIFLDPGGWIAGDTVLGVTGGSTVAADRAIAAMDALRPLVDLPGSTGVWRLASGVELRARNNGGLVLDLALDSAQLFSAGDFAFGGAVGLEFGADGRVSPAVAIFAGLAGGVSGTRAIHLTVAGSNARLFLRTGTPADLEIYPDPASLTTLVTAGLVAALPKALDAIVSTNSDVGEFVGDLGDALLLRQGGTFSAAELTAWASDPSAALRARWQALLVSGFAHASDALPSGLNVTTGTGSVRLEVTDAGTSGSTVAVEFGTTPAKPISLKLSANIATVPFLEVIDAEIDFDGSGLNRIHIIVGPADLSLADDIVLHPVFEIDVGPGAAAGELVEAGLAIPGGDTLRTSYSFSSSSFSMRYGSDTPQEIASGLMHLAIDLLGSFVMSLDAVTDVLNIEVGTTKVRNLLQGVVLTSGGGLDAELFRVVRTGNESVTALVESKLDRLYRLLHNFAGASPGVTIGGQVTISLTRSGDTEPIEIGLAVADRLAIVEGDTMVWIENDNRWINNSTTPGIKIGIVRFVPGANPTFVPALSLSVEGVGIRIGKNNAPLVTSPVALGSVAFHVFARITDAEVLGGAQLQLSEIAVPVGGGTGGDNAVAQGLLSETNDGEAGLAPGFSPALSVQTRPSAQGGGIAFKFSAGEGEGPWWLPIRRQFGPIYIDQLGLGSQIENDTLRSLSVYFDGNVSIAGLEAAVDDLSITHIFSPQKSFFDAGSWLVDLKGLAVSADLSGVTLAGGLRKFGEGTSIEYIGMLAARFSTYGLSVFGGYAEESGAGGFTSFFVFGAVLGPFGGPPAFFLTGVGGGFGINRDIVPPTNVGEFDDFKLIEALDPAFSPPGGLMEYMRDIRGQFPPRRGRFWFAAGISFTSFALVDGVAVVVIEFGQGFELSIFGLARMALPRPEAALVSIELGLMARFSAEEGVIWVQAQLTDNSWLLHKSARLTGGFAYVSWFKGPNKGEFVLTLGGYHPNFRRAGYPVVPRLGFNWSWGSNIVIKAETYFALTSEAIMGGGLFEASAKFGPAFANLSFGCNAIVYFDPFSYEADTHARISAGIRIKTFFGTFKLSFSLGAAIEVRGPDFRGVARIEIGPIDVTVRFGGSDNASKIYLSWVQFTTKYLELAPGNKARALTGIAGRGALPSASGGTSEAGTADGTAAKPFDLISEFELAFTSTVPFTEIDRAGFPIHVAPDRPLGVAPSRYKVNSSVLRLTLTRDDDPTRKERLNDFPRIRMAPPRYGAFPLGVWGPVPEGGKTVPKGEVIEAAEGIDLKFVPKLNGRIPDVSTGGVNYNQVEPNDRKSLPFRSAGRIRAELVREARDQRALLAGLTLDKMPKIATAWQAAHRSPTARRSWLRERAVPMRVGLLSERIVGSLPAGRGKVVPGTVVQLDKLAYGKLKLRGLMSKQVAVTTSAIGTAGTSVTKVAAARKAKRMKPPALSEVAGESGTMISSMLIKAMATQPVIGKTLAAERAVPVTVGRLAGTTISAGRIDGVSRATLDGVLQMVKSSTMKAQSGAVAPRALAAGEIAVFDLPGATASPRFDSSGTLRLKGMARVVGIGLDGGVAHNAYPARKVTKLPAGLRALAVFSGGEIADEGFAGWVEATEVAYLGYSTARCRGGFIRADGATRGEGGKRARTGWMTAGTLADQSGLVETRFDRGHGTFALLLDGRVTQKQLTELALTFSGAQLGKAAPLLVPVDGKTLIVHAIRPDKAARAWTARLGGLAGGQLDGMFAADISPDRLISLWLNGAVTLDLTRVAEEGRTGTEVHWKAPADIGPRPNPVLEPQE